MVISDRRFIEPACGSQPGEPRFTADAIPPASRPEEDDRLPRFDHLSYQGRSIVGSRRGRATLVSGSLPTNPLPSQGRGQSIRSAGCPRGPGLRRCSRTSPPGACGPPRRRGPILEPRCRRNREARGESGSDRREGGGSLARAIGPNFSRSMRAPSAARPPVWCSAASASRISSTTSASRRARRVPARRSRARTGCCTHPSPP